MSIVEFKPTKSSRPGREFVSAEPSGRFSRFGFCHVTQKWVRRDSMLGVNARFYNAEGEQSTVRLRLSEEGWNILLGMAQEAQWENDLKTREELIAEGLVFEDCYADSND